MNSLRFGLIATAIIVSSQVVSAQDLSRYREYKLESNLESVLATSGARAADVKTLHDRPAKIQELAWRAPYTSSRGGPADPVRGAVFSFCDDALYQVVVNYDSGRTNGLTNGDIIQSLSAIYGEPVLPSAGASSPAVLADSGVLAQWDSQESSVTLLRNVYEEFQLVLVSKVSGPLARNAIREAGRMDALDAPRRELEQRKIDAAAAAAALEKIRMANKAAFRP